MPDLAFPCVLTAVSEPAPFEPGDGWVLRDAALGVLVRLAEARHPWFAVDIDSIEGLNADTAGVRFLVEALGTDAVISRRPAVAALATRLGAVGLVRVFAFDSTGLRRSLEAIGPNDSVGLVVSPGIVLPYIEPAQRALLSRPIVAHGLIDDLDQARRLLELADSVVVRPELAAAARHVGLLEPGGGARTNPSAVPLDTAAARD